VQQPVKPKIFVSTPGIMHIRIMGLSRRISAEGATYISRGNAPGDEKKRGKGLKARPMEAVMPQSLLGAIRRTIPTGLIYGAGLQPSVIFVNLPPGALP